MNKTFRAIATIAALTLSASAFAGTSANLLLRGTVGVINDISIATIGSNNLNLDIVNGETSKHVADAQEISNSASGYKIMMSSVNGGLLINTTNASQFTGYTISYDGAAAAAVTTVPTQVKNVASLASLSIVQSEVRVNVDALPTALAGNYEDTVTFSIVAN
ncbi:MAG TPA: hypothetical protein PLJ21_06915 [Pseudobdellovibrionaceae bacterium]|nr:hypothetical protein [Pseudobdellovibrionaceae bacterium]